MIEIIPNWHPIFVHFPIAFATASVFFFVAAKLFRRKKWAVQCLLVGRWMLWGAVIFAGIAAIFGWFAYNSVAHDEAGHLAMTLHRNWALSVLVSLLLLVVIETRSRRSAATPSYAFLVLMVTAWLLVIGTAWHGGELVYRHGLGVMSLPDAEGSDHPHEHGTDHGEIPVQGGDISHEDDPVYSRADAANTVNTPPSKTDHTHGFETPPHDRAAR